MLGRLASVLPGDQMAKYPKANHKAQGCPCSSLPSVKVVGSHGAKPSAGLPVRSSALGVGPNLPLTACLAVTPGSREKLTNVG